ncbi:MAG: competence type IV pilus major pilin ComGC [Candidatus Glassbacteria bacterium]
MFKRKRGEGFTLIELVMVITIIGILAAVAIPNYVDMRTEAREAACNGLRGTLNSAAAIYYADQVKQGNAGSFPATLAAVKALIPNWNEGDIPSGHTWTWSSSTGRVSCSNNNVGASYH